MGKYKYEKYNYAKIGIGVFKSLKETLHVDIQAFNNIAAERVLTATLSQQIVAEIDRQILEYLRQNNETSS